MIIIINKMKTSSKATNSHAVMNEKKKKKTIDKVLTKTLPVSFSCL